MPWLGHCLTPQSLAVRSVVVLPGNQVLRMLMSFAVAWEVTAWYWKTRVHGLSGVAKGEFGATTRHAPASHSVDSWVPVCFAGQTWQSGTC